MEREPPAVELPLSSFVDVLTSLTDLLSEVVDRLGRLEERMDKLNEGFILLYEQGIGPHTLLRIHDAIGRLERKLESMEEDLRAQGVQIRPPRKPKDKLEGMF